jgi:hypothetical protein
VNRVLLVIVALLAIAVPASAKNVKVYIFVAAEGTSDTFSGFTPAALRDSADDLEHAIGGSQRNGLTTTKKRAEARIVVQIMAREEVDGEMRVHGQVTVDGHTEAVTGTSTHRWVFAAYQLAGQLAAWAKAHPEPSPH